MIPLVWTDSLAVGVKELDDDHRELIEMVNDLQLAIQTAYQHGEFDRKEIELALDRLKIHTKTHFEREELYFFNTGYPCQESHRLEHVKLIRRITESVERFHSGADQKAAVEIMQSICDWVVGHFFVTDRKYSVHFIAQRLTSLQSSSSVVAATPLSPKTQELRPSPRVTA